MFIPPGRRIYENLATSYVLVDSLVEDLCEGGFSGIVEVVLRDTDCHIVVNRGKVVAATEQLGDGKLSITSVAEIARRSRGERGRVSVYAYSFDTADAVGGRIAAQPLYSQLSTEFADPERMISKLRRENDREWFVEIRIEGGTTGLIHLKEGCCFVVTSREGAPKGDAASLLPPCDAVLSDLLAECKRAGGMFDVYFKLPKLTVGHEEATGLVADTTSPEGLSLVQIEAGEVALPADHLEAASSKLASFMVASTTTGYSLNREGSIGAVHSGGEVDSDAATSLPLLSEELFASVSDASASSKEDVVIRHADPEKGQGGQEFMSDAEVTYPLDDEPDQWVFGSQLEDAILAEIMADVKRLMGEIASTIENATRSGDSKDSFSINLRAGQLKVADQYPFLDPFGSEFEYYAGEIAFVGVATPTDFTNGLASAMKLAVDSMANSSAQPARLRARVEDELGKLLESQRSELERLGLDKAIATILGGTR